MMKFVAIAIVLCLGLASVQAAIPEHLITSLPGFSGTFPSKQYSGYINVNKTNNRNLHYWFVESENDPANDPVVLWMNGGPGCSSLDGYFYEQGPLHFVAQPPPPMDGSAPADDVPALELNPFRWNKIANMIFLEAPAGVGFSYSDNAFDYFTDDTKTANDNHQFLINFFKAYPEYSKNRFFVSGESYAGVYVPTLVDTIRRHNATNGINLEGFLVGNGCIGTDVGNCSPQGTEFEVDFLHGHALFSDKLYKSIQQQCPDYSNPSNTCYSLLNEMSAQVGGVNVYDVYADCINGGMPVSAEDVAKYMIPLNSRQNRVNHDPHRLAANVGGPVECIDGIYAAKYLNNPEVQKAIHVRTDLGTWTVCSGKLEYNRNTKSLLPIYPTLIQTYRTLIYNGDVDAAVPYPGDEWWTSSFGFEIDNDWHEWDVNNQVAGYATSYNVNGFQFITVKGAGHMVPEYKPEQAFVMFQKFLNNSPF